MKLDGELVLQAAATPTIRDVSPRSIASLVRKRYHSVKEGVQMSKEADPETTQIPMRALAKIMTSADELGLSCIGISGITQSCGASQIAHELASAFSDFGRPTLLVVVSGKDRSPLPSKVEIVDERLGVMKVSERQFSAQGASSKLCEVISEFSEPYSQIVVDLPPLYRNESKFNIGLKEVGSLCDATYLVCETAGHSGAILENAVDFCQLSRVNLAGWVLNDQRIKFQSLVSD